MTVSHICEYGCLANFNSHAHVERDLRITLFMHILFNFNSHAHVERDAICTIVPAVTGYFNSHAHVERDRQLSVLN